MATGTVISDHPSAPQIVENNESEEVVVSPPKEIEDKTKDENSKVNPIEPPSTEEETKTDEEKTKTAASEEKVDEKLKAEDSPTPFAEPVDAALTANPAQSEEKDEDSTAPPPVPEEKVGDKNTETCQDKDVVSSDVADQVVASVVIKTEEKIEIESSKNDAIEENMVELTKKSTDDVPESSVGVVVTEKEDVKEALPEKETEAAAEKGAETSEVGHTKEVTPAVIEEAEKDAADIVAKEVEVEVGKSKETCAETIKPAIEQVVEATSIADEGVNTSKDIQLLSKNEGLEDEKVSDIENKVTGAATEGNASLGDRLEPHTEENKQENVDVDAMKKEKMEETEKLHDVIGSDKSNEAVVNNKEIPKDTNEVEDVPVPKSKQSNNILKMMKQSLVKVKKAIIGKSPNSKTPSSEIEA